MMAGTKKQYLRELKRSLWWRVPQRGTIQEVLADYEGFFDDGIRAGRSEAELCAQFGPPKSTARELSRAEGLSGKPAGLLLLAAFLLAVPPGNVAIPAFLHSLWQRIVMPFIPSETPYNPWCAAPLFPLLWAFWRKAPCAALPAREKRTPVFLCAAALLLGLVPLAASLLSLTRWEGAAPAARHIMRGADLDNGLYFITIALAAVLLFSLLRAWRRSFWYLVPAACCQGFLTGVTSFLLAGNRSVFLLPLPLLGGLLHAVLGAAATAWLIRHGTATEARLREAMRTEGRDRSGRRLALLLLWPPMTLWLLCGFPELYRSENLTPVVMPLLLPLLCLLWRGTPGSGPLSARGRWEMAALFGLPLLFPLACAALFVYGICAPEAREMIGLGNTLNGLSVVCALLTGFIMLLALVKSWLDSPVFLIPAAHCVSVVAAVRGCTHFLHRMDVTDLPTTVSQYISRFAAEMCRPYALGWLGIGITFLVLIRNKRHGHAEPFWKEGGGTL